MHGHSDADNSWYVPKAELEEWERRDPIAKYAAELRAAGVLTDAIQRETEERIHAVIEQDLEAAIASPFPAPEVALEGVYGD